MLNSIVIKKSINKTKYFIRRKVQKKWRFWRAFKYFFLRRSNNFFFSKIRWLFNQKRILWHELSVIYGKNIKNTVYSNCKSKVIFNTRFILVLRNLELRLNIILTRMHFVSKLLQSDCIISKNKVRVNGIIKHRRYLVSIGDLIIYNKKFKSSNRIHRLKWKGYKWKKWKKLKNRRKGSLLKKSVNMYFLLRKSFMLNFMEINYNYFSAILLRYPHLGEISYRNKKQLLTSGLLKKIYFLY